MASAKPKRRNALRSALRKETKEVRLLSPKDYATRKIPKYYSTMYMDGFSPSEILEAKRREMIEEIEERKQPDTTEIEIITKVKK